MAEVYRDAGNVILVDLKNYPSEVQNGSFPQPENWFEIKMHLSACLTTGPR